jgi:hypothetical protein
MVWILNDTKTDCNKMMQIVSREKNTISKHHDLKITYMYNIHTGNDLERFAPTCCKAGSPGVKMSQFLIVFPYSCLLTVYNLCALL